MLKEWLSKIFNKNKLEMQTEARTNKLISILDVIDIPTREYLENKELLDLIDKYEHEYIAMLNSKKHIVHTDFHNIPLKEEMVMNVDLILNVLFGNPFHIYENEGITDIDILKLEIYRTKLQELEYETLAKIVALKEILQALKEKRRIRSNKIESVTSEIESLTSMLVVFESQKRSIEIEQKTYMETHEVEETDEEKTLIKLERVEDLAKVVIPEKLKVLESVKNIKVRVALIERELEIYAYRSQDRLDKIILLLDDLIDSSYSWIKRDITFDKIWIYKDLNFYEGLKILEKEVLVYALYGRNLISKERLKGLYEVKFNALTENINIDRTSPVNDKTNNFELECYKDIVMKKIENVITKKAKVFENNTFFDNLSLTIRKYINLFKEVVSFEGIYDIEKILDSPKILAFILAFDSPFGLNKYFTEFEVSKEEYNINYYETVFKWEENLPLATIFRLMPHTKEHKYDPLERFYDLYLGGERLGQDPNKYYLPEGIVEMVENPRDPLADMNDWHVEYSDSDYMLEVLEKKMKEKIVVIRLV